MATAPRKYLVESPVHFPRLSVLVLFLYLQSANVIRDYAEFKLSFDLLLLRPVDNRGFMCGKFPLNAPRSVSFASGNPHFVSNL